VANGRKNEPESPGSKMTGVTAMTSIRVAYTIAPRTSIEASRMTRAVERPEGLRRSSVSLRTTFSTSTIASSTMSPSAMTKPARIIVLIVMS